MHQSLTIRTPLYHSSHPTPATEDDTAFVREIFLALRTRKIGDAETDDSPALAVKCGGVRMPNPTHLGGKFVLERTAFGVSPSDI